ncbi:MAG TPA: pseudouridine synthase [Spirochaetales bacterium]|nr:pseudouridine synthase [Spirochaetales bacterium]HPG86409.1 pseudouridine synthase [Spirochaetales bacterium]HPM72627.1 pseudouridine synthase [Spirochaetales bacterium]
MNEEIPIVFMDESILVISKPAGILSFPDRYEPDARVAARELEMEYGRLWPVNRLDRDASGVQLLARDEAGWRLLCARLEDREVTTIYHAVVAGRPTWSDSSCDLSLTADGDRMHRTVIDGSGKPALTDFAVLGCHAKMAIVEARPLTGRAHQVRVHLAALGYPVACDPLYGDGKPVFLSKIKRRWKGDEDRERPLISRTALHAFSIAFAHPLTGEAVRVEAPYPKDFGALVKQLRKL